MKQNNKKVIKTWNQLKKINHEFITSIIDVYLAGMKRYMLNYYETIKIEKIYKNIPSQIENN